MSTITDLIPDRVDGPDAELRVIDVDDEETDEVLDVLSSDTRRAIYRELFEEPASASELATSLDTTVQNVTHHVSTLEAADLIEPVGHRYSEKGNEMTVYGPSSDPLVFVGQADLQPRVSQTLMDVVSGIGILAAASLLVQWGVYQIAGAGARTTSAIDPASRTTGPQGTEWLPWLVFDAGEPGLVFFFGCLAIAGIATLLYRH